MNNYPIATILGGGGFIGRYLVRNLSKSNYRCFIPTRKPYQKGYLKTQATPGAIELIEFNTKNFSEIEDAIKNSDVVINLIGILYETRKQKFTKIHSDIPDMVSKLCAKHKVKKSMDNLLKMTQKDSTIKPVIDSIFPFEDASKAHQHIQDKKNFGKVLLDFTKL